jgi:two-component system, OmpR family, response regulator
MSPQAQAEIRHKTQASSRLLLVEDDVKLARTVKRGLESEGYAVDLAHTGHEALASTEARDYDAVILDVLLPGVDGHQVCRTLRGRDPWLPIIMLTALDAVEDRIRGLDTGADDYLVKPFDFGELVARVRALIRRGPAERPTPLAIGELHADPITRTVTWGADSVELSPREYELLEFMLRRPDQVITRDQLLEHVWSTDYDGSPNIVDVYIGYLRKKLEQPAQEPLIRTVRGAGFVLSVGAVDDAAGGVPS